MRLIEWIEENTNILIELLPCNFIFGIELSTPDMDALNNIILLAKKFIYIARCKGDTKLDFDSLKNYIKFRVSVEKLSFKNIGVRKFENKWRNFDFII